MENKNIYISVIYKAAGFLLLIALWQIVAGIYKNDIIFPTFSDTIKRILEIMVKTDLSKEILITLNRGVQGLIIGSLAGIVSGIISGLNKYGRQIIMPLMMFCQATPVISFLLLFLIWFDNKNIPFIVVVISVMPSFAISVVEGIKNTDKKLIEMAKFYKIKTMKIIKDIYMPAVSGYILSAFKTALGITFRVAVMAEVLAHPGNGIGERMNSARINVETVDIFAWTIIIIVITIGFEKIVSFIFEKILTGKEL